MISEELCLFLETTGVQRRVASRSSVVRNNVALSGGTKDEKGVNAEGQITNLYLREGMPGWQTSINL